MKETYYQDLKNGKRRIVASFRNDCSTEEKEADLFAMELLIPKESILKEYHEMVIPTSHSLAKLFAVPEFVMQKRLDDLNLQYI